MIKVWPRPRPKIIVASAKQIPILNKKATMGSFFICNMVAVSTKLFLHCFDVNKHQDHVLFNSFAFFIAEV